MGVKDPLPQNPARNRPHHFPRPRGRAARRVMAAAASIVHKNMMQLLLGVGAITQEELMSKLEECIQTHPNEAKRAKLRVATAGAMVEDKVVDQDKATLDAVVKVLNDQLEALGMKIAKGKHDKKVYYGLVNLRSDDLVKHGTNLDKGEQDFLHKILDEIDACDETPKEIEEMVAHNKRNECQPRLNSDDASACLQQLEHEQWLYKSDEGNFSLGIRIILQRMYQPNATTGAA